MRLLGLLIVLLAAVGFVVVVLRVASRQEVTVNVKALVDTDGRVVEAYVEYEGETLTDLKDVAAVEAVRKWCFRPAMQHGKPVKVWISIPIKLQLVPGNDRQWKAAPRPDLA